MTNPIADPGHGHSPAAWTAVIIMLVAMTIGTIAFCLSVVWLVWASAVVFLLGLVVGWVMARLGWGVRGPKFQPKAH